MISRKWGFVDLINWRLYSESEITPRTAASRYSNFEAERLKYNSKPEELLRLGKKALYDYSIAFKFEAGKKKSVKTRHDFFTRELS